MGKRAVLKPKYLGAKLLAIRQNFGFNQTSMARMLDDDSLRVRLSEFESGRRMPNWIVLLYYARLAGIPLEFIVDDDIDLDYFTKYLTVADLRRGELTDTEHYVTLFWRQ